MRKFNYQVKVDYKTFEPKPPKIKVQKDNGDCVIFVDSSEDPYPEVDADSFSLQSQLEAGVPLEPVMPQDANNRIASAEQLRAQMNEQMSNYTEIKNA